MATRSASRAPPAATTIWIRTRELLQKALIEMVGERGYDAIAIQDIVDRANVGRTTFYLHYSSKDELFMSCHEAIVHEFHFWPLYPLTREELLSPNAPAGMTSAIRHLQDARARLYPLFQGRDSPLIPQRIRDRSARQIEANLRAAFAEADSIIPFDVLANYLAGASSAAGGRSSIFTRSRENGPTHSDSRQALHFSADAP